MKGKRQREKPRGETKRKGGEQNRDTEAGHTRERNRLKYRGEWSEGWGKRGRELEKENLRDRESGKERKKRERKTEG